MTIARLALLAVPSFDGWEEEDGNLFGYDDVGDDDDDDIGDDDIGDDEVGDDDIGDDEVGEDEVGAARRGRRRGRRGSRRGKRGAPSTTGKRKMNWGITVLADSVTTSGTTSASIRFRLQHAFKAKDISGTGSTAGAKITTIMFGDQVVFSNATGVPIELFATGSFLRNVLEGQSLRAGLDIVVSGTVATAGDVFAINIVGSKPIARC